MILYRPWESFCTGGNFDLRARAAATGIPYSQGLYSLRQSCPSNFDLKLQCVSLMHLVVRRVERAIA